MKKVTGQVKLQIPAGKANPAPPIGPALATLGHEIHALVLDQDDAALVGRCLGEHGPKLGAFESNSHGSDLQRR